MIRLTHVRLLVSDFKACFRFYRDVMGFAVDWGDEDTAYAAFNAGDAMLALYRRGLMAEAVGNEDKPFHAESQDTAAVIFLVDAVDATFALLESKGVNFVTEPEDRPSWGVRTAHFRDPDGNLLEINQGLRS
jgi:catechol 2,3-dioxygenase-like lactoylglutathione lyase family enzyme